jgi:hypothetical protein
MLKNVEIATAGMAIWLPNWGKARATVGGFAIGAGIGFAVGGLGGAAACGTAALAA